MKEKIIRLFYKNMYSQFTINEISRKIGISYSYVHKQVETLAEENFIIIDERSGRKYCKPNYNNPEVKTTYITISKKIADEFLKRKKKTALIIKNLLFQLPKKTDYNLLSVVLFGSLTKEIETKKSDVDLFFLVPSKEEYDEVIDIECVSLSRSFDVEVNPVISEPVSFVNMLSDRENNIAKEIMKNKIIMYGAEKFCELVFEVIHE